MIKHIEIEELGNGYWVKLTTKDNTREFVYANTTEFKMIEEIGKFLLGYRIDVKAH